MVTEPINLKFENLIDTLRKNEIAAADKRIADEKKADTRFKRDEEKLKNKEQELINKEKEQIKKLADQFNKEEDKLEKLKKADKKDKEAIKKQKEYLDKLQGDIATEALEISNERKRLEKERKEDLAELRRGQKEVLNDREETAKKESIMSDEKKEVERKKQAVEKLKEIATGKGLNPEEDAEIKRATIEIRKEEFKLRTEGLEGTKLMSANLEELGNDLKDKGLDPEKNKKFQEESLKVSKALLDERLKNAESKSERMEILKEQKAKDKKALSFQQRQLVRFSEFGDRLKNAIPETDKVVGGVLGFLGKAALITLLFMLPKILNSKAIKDTVEYLDDKKDSIIKGFKAIGKFFLSLGKAFLNIIAIIGDFASGDTEAGMTKLKKTFTGIFDPKDPNSLVAKLTVAVGLLALLKVGRLISVLGLLGGGISKIINRGEKGLKDNKITDPNKTTPDKTPQKSKVIGQVKGQNVVKGPGGKMFFADAEGNRLKGGKALNKSQLGKMKFLDEGPIKNLEKFGKLKKLTKFASRVPVLGYILSLGTVATTLMNEEMSVKEKAKVIGGELGGLAGAGLGALALSFIPVLGTAIGGIAGYFGGQYLFTKLFEYLLGDEGAANDIKKDYASARKSRRPKRVPAGGGGEKRAPTGRGALKKAKMKTESVPAENITGVEGGSYGDAIMTNASAAATMGMQGGGGDLVNTSNIIDNKTINNSSSYHMVENILPSDTSTYAILRAGS